MTISLPNPEVPSFHSKPLKWLKSTHKMTPRNKEKAGDSQENDLQSKSGLN